MSQIIENPMVLPYYQRTLNTYIEVPRCDCGCRARFKINGELRCLECAEDEGVEVINHG
ncbi:hypothetical protein ACFC0X_24865 [Paenibacillus chitinolyticus]|uniref:hypothetical protein n=1 Tax=Paenibacillus chitinolyticus TaxID=79263 RepID=UPI0035D76838